MNYKKAFWLLSAFTWMWFCFWLNHRECLRAYDWYIVPIILTQIAVGFMFLNLAFPDNEETKQ